MSMEAGMFRFLPAAVLIGVGLAAGGCATTDNPSVAYLQRAQAASRAHDGAAALSALNDAENAWLISDSARGNPVVHHVLPTLREIGTARVAVQQSRWEDADRSIAAALSTVDGPDQG
jgi:hypothetical protein